VLHVSDDGASRVEIEVRTDYHWSRALIGWGVQVGRFVH
jgi:hypothetical protein